MLKDKDRIFQNLYNDKGSDVESSKNRGDWIDTAEIIKNGYIIKGSIQKCSSNSDVFNRTCSTNVWFVTIDKNGQELSNEILEEIIMVENYQIWS